MHRACRKKTASPPNNRIERISSGKAGVGNIGVRSAVIILGVIMGRNASKMKTAQPRTSHTVGNV
jgi:hypothetical protein